MFRRLVRGAAPLLLLLTTGAQAQSDAPIGPADLRQHIDRLASDRFQGRAPGTEGETLTIDYIAEQFRARGLEPAGEDGSWFQPIGLVERTTERHQVSWSADGRALPFDQTLIALQGREAEVRLDDAPVVFAGHGVRLPERGIDQLAGVDLQGAVVFVLLDAPDVPGFPPLAERVRMVAEAGAAAVIAVTGPDIQWSFITSNYQRPTTKLASQAVPPVVGAMPATAVQQLVDAAGASFERLLNEQPGSSFRAVALPIRADLEVRTAVTPYTTRNVVGRIRGSANSGENLLYLGHWDHFGLCRPEGEADRICNGAVDNASGIAAMIEIAGRLAAQPRTPRDILFLATTAEEMGLLGAEYFATHPTVPLSSIVAAINLDTIAIHPAGEPVAVIGRGNRALDAAVDETVAAVGRRLDTDDEAASFVQRQDGWALMRAGVPAIMVGGSFSNMALLNAFLSGDYHGPEDEAGPELVLDGAAEDSNLLVALGRRLADPAIYRPEASEQE
ncbi:M28 family peptidase [Sphingosinicella sp. CPCC 101087]|uniref:M28 family peptidase n=1 Tax=Sphingosinicella sp. CPCC 101087 TaxID=2497754 RepID=UPI00101CBBA8|nr:M28 family peptidase [Sphingosinicella sp. CPCC 101087]